MKEIFLSVVGKLGSNWWFSSSQLLANFVKATKKPGAISVDSEHENNYCDTRTCSESHLWKAQFSWVLVSQWWTLSKDNGDNSQKGILNDFLRIRE